MKTIIIVSSNTLLEFTLISDAAGLYREKPDKKPFDRVSDEDVAHMVLNVAKTLGVKGRFVWQPEWVEEAA